MNMTIPKLVNRLRCFVAWFDTSEAEILIDGKPIKSFDYELEPVLPPDGFDRRMERLNISTKPHIGGTTHFVEMKSAPLVDEDFEEGAKKKEEDDWRKAGIDPSVTVTPEDSVFDEADKTTDEWCEETMG